MQNVQNKQMFYGSGGAFEEFNLTPLSEDDLRRQPSRNLIPRFFKETVGTVNGGFIEREMVEILVPGDAKSGPVHKLNPELIKRFPVQYQRWKAGLAEVEAGTPLELIVGTGPIIFQLKAMNIHTAEALAEMDDGQIDQIRTGGRELRDRARRLLNSKAMAAEAAKQEAKDKEIADLKSQVAELLTLVKGGKVPKKAAKEEDEDDQVGDGSKVPDGAVRVTASKPVIKRKRRGE